MQLTIEKLIYGGEGLAHLPADEKGRGKAVFVPFVLPGENVEAEAVEERPGFVRTQLKQVIEAAPQRVPPPCTYFGRCGGCHYQHAPYEQQLRLKAEILAETVQRIAKIELPASLEIHASPPWNYRNRTRMRVAVPQEAGKAPTSRGGAQFAIGYNHFGSHEILAVEQCPISSPLINRALAVLWEEGRAGHVPEVLREVQFFASGDDSALLIEFSVAMQEKPNTAFEVLAELLRARLPELAGVVVFPAGVQDEDGAPHLRSRGGLTKTPTSAEDGQMWGTLCYGVGEITYRTSIGSYRVSAGAFFQTNRFLIEELVNVVVGDTRGRLALDLYAGVGLFSVVLARNFARVIAVESSPFAVRDRRVNAAGNVKVVEATTQQFLEKSKKLKPDFVVVDPPRAGMGERISRLVASLGAPQLTYVSCDPATLARDLRVLVGAGYRVRQAHLLDLFPQTFHIESVWRLEK